MAHSRNDLIREGVQAEVDNSAKTMEDAEGHVEWVMDEEAIVDLVMRHVDPLVQENHDLKREVENLQEVTRALRERAEQAEAVVVRQLGPCTGCYEAPEEYCPRHGRSYNDMVEHLDRMVGSERARIARVEKMLNDIEASGTDRITTGMVREVLNAQGINAVPPDAPRPVHGPEDGPDKVEDDHLPSL